MSSSLIIVDVAVAVVVVVVAPHAADAEAGEVAGGAVGEWWCTVFVGTIESWEQRNVHWVKTNKT